MDNVHSTRDSKAADLVHLVTETGNGCGLASDVGANASTAFAVGTRDCSITNYTFQHELGHLQSARHNPEADSTATPYAYGHGYQDTQKAWRTIMAYNCSPNCPRLNYWSNPSLILNGRPMGTAATHHYARVLNNTKVTVAGFR
jgi:peptidyl-Asp metalloendopeptidase